MTTAPTPHPYVDPSGPTVPDPHRPGFHLTAPQGWLNDPNGLCQWDGVFHLFYQYNPDAPVHNQIHWGHVTSTDLVHWRDEPIALAPSSGPDAQGCWSGVLVDDDGTPTLVYSGHTPSARPTQTCCIAVGTPELATWEKLPDNPVIDGPPPGLQVTEFRDHTVWREDGQWHQAMGSGLVGRGGALLHFLSPDLRQWTYQGPLVTADGLPTGGPFSGTTWECPDLFVLPTTEGEPWHILVFSAWDYGRTLYPLYLVGHLVDGSFIADAAPRHLDLGLRHFYAPQSFAAADGRRIQFGWAQEARPEAAVLDAGWTGVMSLPRTLTLRSDGTLAAAPVAEVDALRDGAGERLDLVEGTRRLRLTGDQLDLCAEIVLPSGSGVEFAIRASEDLREATFVRLQRADDGAARLILDRSHSRSRDAGDLDDYDLSELGGELPALIEDRVELRIIVDHSMIEVFAGGVPLTARVYPSSAEATGVEVTVLSSAKVDLVAWPMKAALRRNPEVVTS
ncbi:beta-fructofuranosidase [Propionicimonas paludicola]|uniref:beta-fructofuranosidase n=1 Tax=Propionicimonas paludicola TaxID=185243 RepID=A0A2A9CMH3_9ACTN|nr:glycoside hydrolase family 32 protein [Propionicimonas paludicola]PFG15518.1 beta-fructofuranosidase [Propionicimonas paludicola]